MKKSVLVSLVLMMVAPLSLMAKKHKFDSGLYWELNGTTLTISGNGPMADYSHPWRDEGPVEKVVIGNGVTSIGKVCFWEYNRPHHLKSVVIGNSVTSIGESAFQDCSSLTSVNIPNSVTSIEKYAFDGCSGLTSVSIPNSVTSIGVLAFGHCSSLNSISIPNSVTSIGDAAFGFCSSLTSIQSLPLSVLESGEREWDRINLPKEAVYKYIVEHRNDERIRPIALAAEEKIKEAEEKNKEAERISSVKAKGGYSSARTIKSGNMTYYIVGKNGRYGLANANGQEIVPAELDAIEQCGTGFLRFKVNGYWGVMNYTGKIIIPTDRGYTKIGDYVSFTKRFPYEMNGYKGECNNLGQQVSKIKTGSATASTSSSSSTKTTSGTASTSSGKSNTGSQTQTIVVQHQRDPIPMQEWQQCMRCGGSGQCSFDACCGSGWYFRGDRRVICVSCHGSGKCQGCAGQGGHYITVYR